MMNARRQLLNPYSSIIHCIYFINSTLVETNFFVFHSPWPSDTTPQFLQRLTKYCVIIHKFLLNCTRNLLFHFWKNQDERGHQVKHLAVQYAAQASDQERWKATLLGKWNDFLMKTGEMRSREGRGSSVHPLQNPRGSYISHQDLE